MMIISGLDIDLYRRNTNRMHLRVRTDGSVYLSAPRWVSDGEIERFVDENREWILGNVRRMQERNIDYRDGSQVTILGEVCTLHVIGSEKPYVRRDGNDIYVFTPDDVGGVLKEYYRSKVKDVAPRYLDRWSSVTGLRYTEFRTKTMKTRWGTCNPRDGRIWLNTRLAEKPVDCIEYVVLHEICHLRYPDHGKGFRDMMDAYMPDWRERRKRLNGKVSP